ncbi:hypothetical protein [Enterococcus phoeniculicola]|jgi:hypothetical protein|uniref:Uncharacterized protein n=1 Tax=Enterococcus phoeniculicola ATCC BAA-412 TaxID=1158610 RepID=R3TY41_9ENTE|nr:hypothetical protein [Enterococcus phoeniculicola]EOL46053.1 hypothetical protein UC3_00858 [Enterococcus phoeniculicola ATCC BAA-412]EOT77102.1 hypothetical protein I589_02064 [Enterococcus phoeniculicola ATCC BAA-412]
MINRVNTIREKKSKGKSLLYLISLAVLIGVSYYQFILETKNDRLVAWLFYNVQTLYTVLFGIPLLFMIYLTIELEFPIKKYMFLVRLGGRKQLFLTDFSFLLKLLFRFFICLLLMVIVIGLPTQKQYFSWDKELIDYYTSVLKIVPNTQVAPLIQVCFAWSFFFLYLFFIANSYLLLTFVSKNRAVAFLILFFFIGIQAYFYKLSQDTLVSDWLPFTHYLLYTGTEPVRNFSSLVLKNLRYWGLSLMIIDGILFYCYTHKSVGE